MPGKAGTRCRECVTTARDRSGRRVRAVPIRGARLRAGAPPERANDWVVGETLAFLIEAGGRRIYLEAGARGLAACAVGAFHDDEAAALVAADPAREWVLHFAALGRPVG